MLPLLTEQTLSITRCTSRLSITGFALFAPTDLRSAIKFGVFAPVPFAIASSPRFMTRQTYTCALFNFLKMPVYLLQRYLATAVLSPAKLIAMRLK